ncbi:PREDICTED: uncharacterized protein LOC109588071, partial [Amphimedon queenslandica]|uniref:FZ domain-containing protein n=1 Tax=Amphimedon queenslandica TaxID=400682 RepID=A0AAN0JSH2_AMPQE
MTSLSTYFEFYKQCQQQSSAFICQYFFPLADCSTGKSYKATKEDCLLISTGVCSDLWTLANNFSYGSLLPDCSTLPNAVNDSSSVTIPIEGMNDTNGTEGIMCREDFVKTDLMCEPRCDSFEQSSHLDSQILIYSEVVAISIILTLCIVTIIVAVKEYKILLAYPSVLVLFQIIDTIVLGIVALITAIYRYKLYCGSVSLLETLNNPTLFCKFSGHLTNIEAKSDKFEAALMQYFECEAFGHIPGKCDRGTFEKIYNPYMSAIAYILM